MSQVKNSAWARLVLLSFMNNPQTKVTKKLCNSYFTGEPSQAKRAIEFLSSHKIVDFDKWVFTWEYVETIEEESYKTPLEKFSWRYGKKFHSSFKAYWQLLINASNWKRYFPEEYFNLLLTEVKKDKFWGKVITEEMLLRKFLMLDKQFWWKIPKKVWDMESVASIF